MKGPISPFEGLQQGVKQRAGALRVKPHRFSRQQKSPAAKLRVQLRCPFLRSGGVFFRFKLYIPEV